MLVRARKRVKAEMGLIVVRRKVKHSADFIFSFGDV